MGSTPTPGTVRRVVSADMANDNVKYRVIPLEEQLTAETLAGWTATATKGGEIMTFRGRCPQTKCGHDLVISRRSKRGTVYEAAEDSGLEQWVVECNCDEEHENRPSGVTTGCGRYWTVIFPSLGGGPGHVRAGRIPTLAEREFNDVFAAQHSRSLEQSRKWADGWSKVLAGLVGLLGAAQLLKGRDLVEGVSSAAPIGSYSWQDLVGLALLAALALGVVAALAAGRAAYGWPKDFKLSNTEATDGELAAFERIVEGVYEKRRNWMVGALLAATSVVALTGFVGYVLWFQQATSVASETWCVTTADGGQVEVTDLTTLRGATHTLIRCT